MTSIILRTDYCFLSCRIHCEIAGTRIGPGEWDDFRLVDVDSIVLAECRGGARLTFSPCEDRDAYEHWSHLAAELIYHADAEQRRDFADAMERAYEADIEGAKMDAAYEAAADR